MLDFVKIMNFNLRTLHLLITVLHAQCIDEAELSALLYTNVPEATSLAGED